MTKITSLITNPMSSVILSWVSNSNGENSKKKIIKMTILANVPVILIVAVLTAPLTYIALKILYSQYLAEALILIIPISIASGFGTAVTLIKSVLLKFGDTNRLVGSYILYMIIFMIFGYTFSKNLGLMGFAVANLISKVVLWISFIILLVTARKEEEIK